MATVIKNCDPFVSEPAFAMIRTPHLRESHIAPGIAQVRETAGVWQQAREHGKLAVDPHVQIALAFQHDLNLTKMLFFKTKALFHVLNIAFAFTQHGIKRLQENVRQLTGRHQCLRRHGTFTADARIGGNAPFRECMRHRMLTNVAKCSPHFSVNLSLGNN